MEGTIDWKIVRNLAVGSVPAAALTLYFISGVDHGAQTKLLTLILGVVLVLVAVVLALRP